jgi:hypothetical protein
VELVEEFDCLRLMMSRALSVVEVVVESNLLLRELVNRRRRKKRISMHSVIKAII